MPTNYLIYFNRDTWTVATARAAMASRNLAIKKIRVMPNAVIMQVVSKTRSANSHIRPALGNVMVLTGPFGMPRLH